MIAKEPTTINIHIHLAESGLADQAVAAFILRKSAKPKEVPKTPTSPSMRYGFHVDVGINNEDEAKDLIEAIKEEISRRGMQGWVR